MAGLVFGRSGGGRLQMVQLGTASIMLGSVLVPMLVPIGWISESAILVGAAAWLVHGALSTLKLTSTGDASALWLSLALGCLLAYAFLIHVRHGAPVLGVNGVLLGLGSMVLFFIAMTMSMRTSKAHAERELARMRTKASLHTVAENDQ